MSALQIGYAAMLEQFHPTEAVELSAYAESKGFTGVMAADHFQPWVPAQGNSAFVWNVLTAVGERTTGDFGPGVTAPVVPLAPGDRRPGVRDPRGDVPGPALAGPRLRRGAERARRRRLLAGGARADQPHVRGRSRSSTSCSRRRSPARTRSTTGKYFKLEIDAAVDDGRAAADPRRDRRPRHREARGQGRRRADHRRCAAREDLRPVRALRRGAARGGQGPLEGAEGAAGAPLLGDRPTRRRSRTRCTSGRTAG